MEILLSTDVRQFLLTTLDQHNPADCSKDESAQSNKVNDLFKCLCRPPMFTTLRVNTLRYDIAYVEKHITEILHDEYAKLDWQAPSIKRHDVIDELLVIENQLSFDVTKLEKELIVDSFCGAAVLRGADVFAQGVMGAPNSMSTGDWVSVYADVHGLCLKGLTRRFEGRKEFLGNGLARLARGEIFCAMTACRGIAIEMSAPLVRAPKLDRLPEDMVLGQNLPSVVCVRVLDPRPGETILDMCAAPGGKTTHIATLMGNEGVVIGLDKSRKRVELLKRNCVDWGLIIVRAFSCDARDAVSTCPRTSLIESTYCPPYPVETFDRILLDSPCSALGQRPSFASKLTLKQLQSYPKLQRQLFTKAVELLKPGGVLVYSTCTITLEENENLVHWALQTFPALALSSQEPHLGGTAWPGSLLDEDQERLVQRFDPSRILDGSTTRQCDQDTIGFFIAKFRKHS